MEEGRREGDIYADDWHKEETTYLIWVLKEMNFTFVRNSEADAWDEVAGRLKMLGYDRTGKMCEVRFKYLLKCCNLAYTGKPDRDVFMKLETIYGTPLQESKAVDPQPDPITTSLPQAQSLVGSTSSSKWSEIENHVLIQLRVARIKATNMLWEEISASMQRLGFNRNPKACKKRWKKLIRRYQRKKVGGKESHWRYFLILKAAERILKELPGSKKSKVNATTQFPMPHNLDLNLEP